MGSAHHLTKITRKYSMHCNLADTVLFNIQNNLTQFVYDS